jgi:uncharacterized cupredoxin-like copper-binding protein
MSRRIAYMMAMGFVLAGLAATLVACGGGETIEVQVSLREWSITSTVNQVKPENVRFVVTNDGQFPHEFVIVKSDLSIEELPVADGKVDEEKVARVDEIEPFGAGETQTKTLDLAPGKYILICNIVERPPGEPIRSHYQEGMRAAFLISD